MQPSHLKFGGGLSHTVLNPFVAVAVLIAGIMILCLHRNKVIAPFLTASLLIPTDQVVLVGGLHFPMQRILILFGLIKLFRVKSETRWKIFGDAGFRKLDIVFLGMSLVVAVNSVLLWQESAALTNQLGELYTIVGTFVILRFFIRTKDDVERTIRLLVWITLFIACIMIQEQVTGKNPYAILGGARSLGYVGSMMRNGRFRAEGCFAQPILAGTFGAIVLPLFVGLWWTKKTKGSVAILGVAAATAIVVTSNSSTPVLAFGGGVLAMLMWPLRNQMRFIRWGIVLCLVSLHMVMKAPVWDLISRIDISGGSEGYHRYQLVDQCIRHFWDWWLIGTRSNAQWGWDMWDTANQYVGTAESSGLIALVLFIAAITYGFKYLGKARRASTNRKNALFLWCMGAALLANAIGFFGVSFFDQTTVIWYTLLALISAATAGQIRAHGRITEISKQNLTTAAEAPIGQLIHSSL